MNQDSNEIKKTVLDYDDIRKMVPFFDGKPKLVNTLMRWLDVDKVNWIHEHNCATPGVPFTTGLLNDLGVKITYNSTEVLDNLPEGGFITVSNHPFGALDGIMLINILGRRRPDVKVMVNMILNYISAMRPNFIAVDALASNDPAKRAVSVRGIAEAMRHVKDGHPLGFFPAGAVSKLNSHLELEDREWQPSVMRIIQKCKVPVIPIYFHGRNSHWFNFLGVVDWRLRTLRLPAEVFRRSDYNFKVSIGQPISPEEQAQYKTPEELGAFLKQQTYKLKSCQ
ncbi:lysophospholipid acyltransferase family protein [Sodaliphilus sp.]|uniref:lysophospholipid acyltransferase family protein n=1 Tax=Sodaliphilus sp. TaxID=2815818 RepID=UPI00388D2468